LTKSRDNTSTNLFTFFFAINIVRFVFVVPAKHCLYYSTGKLFSLRIITFYRDIDYTMCKD